MQTFLMLIVATDRRYGPPTLPHTLTLAPSQPQQFSAPVLSIPPPKVFLQL